MAYIGQQPVNTFSPIPSKDSFTGDGSTTTFDLAGAVVSAGQNALEVFVNNVRQEPGSGKAFTLGVDGSGDLKRITFSAAPASGASIYVINDKTSSTSTVSPSDLNGAELILDADADSSITADTDDRIDFKLANADHIQLGTSSGDTTIKIATDAKDLQFLQADGNKIFEINDGNFVGVGGNSAAPGEIRIYEDTDNGSHYTGFKAGNNTASVAYVLPTADGSAGTQLTTDGSGTLSWSAATLSLTNDGNNRITTGTGSGGLNAEANLTFDGSTLALTGAATVSSTLAVSGVTTSNAGVVVDNITIDGTEIDLSSGDLTVDVAGDIILDADGGEILFHDATTAIGHVSMASSNITIKSLVSDGDIIFQGNDGGAAITALTLDMSAAGSATFNHDLFLSTADAKMGIGTTSPGRSLEISQSIPIIRMTDTDASAGYMEMGNGGSEFKFDLDKDDALDSSILTFKVDGSYVMKFRDGASEFADGSASNPSITNIGDINTGLFFSAADTMAFSAGGTSQFTMADGAISPVTDSDVDLGTSSLYYKNAYIDAILTTGNITSPSNIIISVDTDADDVSGDSATGRLTLGAGQDLNLYHGGTHSYIVNDTGNLVIDTAGDLTFDAAGNDFKFLANGTEILNITNSSSDVIIKPLVDAKDIIFQQRDGTEVARIEDNATFNVSVAGKFAYAGTAVTSTAAELNIVDGEHKC